MVYTEIKEKNLKKYYYRVKSIREGKNIKKKRIYLGVNLSKKQLSKKEKEADKELISLNNLLNEQEIRYIEKIRKEYLKQPKENLDNRYETFCSLFTYNTNAIEGNTLTLQETSQLLFENIVPSAKSLREINEVINHKEAFDFILKTKEDISKKFILTLHKIVVKNTLKKELEDQIGKYRNIQVYIRGSEWLPPKSKDVPKKMRTLLLWYSRNKNKIHPLIIAAYFHSAFEGIHPFVDGNGRVGRLLMNFILYKNNYPMINIPNSRKIMYYNTLQEAQINNNLRLFIGFLIELLKEEKVRF
jgi:Fic family protein